MHIGIGIVLMLIIATVSLILAVSRLKENGAALEHSARELLLRLESLEESLAKMERGHMNSMSRIEEAISASARSDREELARNFAAFSESQSRYIKDFAEIHRNATDALSSRIDKLAGYGGRPFETPGASRTDGDARMEGDRTQP
jgi:DNA anti-recombination protein RmuC